MEIVQDPKRLIPIKDCGHGDCIQYKNKYYIVTSSNYTQPGMSYICNLQTGEMLEINYDTPVASLCAQLIINGPVMREE